MRLTIITNVLRYCRCVNSFNQTTVCRLSTSAVHFQDATRHSTDSPGAGYQLSPVSRSALPQMTSRKLQYLPPNNPPKEAWVETLSSIENDKIGITSLHPDIFATFPRIDILWWNIYWQNLYKKIDYRKALTRAELKGGGKKPWPQKGMGKARHGSNRSPIWIKGGKAHGPRGPRSFFFMLPRSMRVLGLRVALSVKYAQGDLHIVDSLELPSDEPRYLEDLIESRGWGLSVLFVDDTDMIERNLALAVDQIKPYNAMPVYGLNVYSMLKHETLVLSLSALERIEERLLFQMHQFDFRDKKFSMHPDYFRREYY